MAKGSNWSRLEVEATVADYFAMFEKELRGESYSKTEHRRRLLPLLDDRTEGAIEYKHQNISAVLLELGFPYIPGYKPHRNYQALLLEVVTERLEGAVELRRLLDDEVTRPAGVPSVDDILSRLVDPPNPSAGPRHEYIRESGPRRARVRDYLAEEARNTSLGAAGERFVLNFEVARLLAGDRDRLANRVEQVSATRGDHEGFDVLSFEEDGRERLIEVKTTAFGAMTPFFVSQNQVATSQREDERYHVYRLYTFRKDPRFFAVSGAIGTSFSLEPTEFRARMRSRA